MRILCFGCAQIREFFRATFLTYIHGIGYMHPKNNIKDLD